MSMLKPLTMLFWICLLSSGISPAFAEKNDWAEGTPGKDNGASRDYYNRAASLTWTNYLGDWRDAKNEAQGKVPYASAEIADDNKKRFIEWDVTGLVGDWRGGKYQNQGFFLRTVGGGGSIRFCSRENPQADQRPQLVVVGAEGTANLAPQADTTLIASTFRSQGDGENLNVSNSPTHALLRFDLAPAEKLGKFSKATLRLYANQQNGTATVGVFRCAQGHSEPPAEPVLGLAVKYPGDKGIGKDADVIFATGFESPKWSDEWTQAAPLKALDITANDSQHKFQPLTGNALRVIIAEGAKTGMNTLYKFKKEIGREPEEVYFRYYLRLGDDWNQTVQGGKLPGIAGTYGIAGWGGRKSNGNNGWSARGKFNLTIPADNPLAGTTPIGTYCYHADMEGFYGTNWIWHKNYLGFLEKNRWYCIEQHVKLNTPGEKDGVLRAWIDGQFAFEKTDIRFRHVDKLKIEEVWMNVYHGGTKSSPYDQHLFIDNVVIARQYIGPMKR
jgi:hypothetical protein